MKLLKRVLLTFLLLFILSSLGGYLYFKNKFQAPANQLQITTQASPIPFTWKSDGQDSAAFLLVPVTVPGCSKTFYLQLDTGAPYTVFYKNKMEAIQKKGGKVSLQSKDQQLQLVDFSFQVGPQAITAKEAKVLNYGDSVVHWTDSSSHDVIGSLGSDFIENKVLTLYYKKGYLTLTETVAESVPAGTQFMDFEFDNRRVLLPAQINGEETSLLSDTGASAYELLTNKATWNELSSAQSTHTQAKVNSWGKTLTAYTTTTLATATFGPVQLPIKRATYMEGMALTNRLLMQFSGMGGMTGNKLFKEKTLILDAKHQKFAILD